MMRMTSNPFHSLMLDKIARGIDDPRPPVSAQRIAPPVPRDPKTEKDISKDFFNELDVNAADGANIF
jgi:hypothetical protein